MIIISSSEPDGTFYVETKNLDGETSLKQKSVAQGLNGSYSQPDEFQKLKGKITVEKPNNRIDKFDAVFDS